MSSRTKHKKNEELAIAIPVTPMLDMAFQLLTFFIFTYHPSEMKEGQMEMMLPGGASTRLQKQEDVNPESMSDPEVDAQSKITLRVGTQKGDEGGAIRFPIEIEGLSKESAGSLKDLEAKLVTMRARKRAARRWKVAPPTASRSRATRS